jgi:tRNA A37 threonylcarbamoyltransferase TsaD
MVLNFMMAKKIALAVNQPAYPVNRQINRIFILAFSESCSKNYPLTTL